MDKGAKVYVAGHRGLLGSAVTRKLREKGYRNLLLATREQVDLTDQKAAFEFLERERPEYVFDCAAKVGGIQANMNAPAAFLYENLAIQNNLFEGCRRASARKLLFVGSSCIYPREAAQPLREEALLTGPFEPTNEGYAIAKVAGVRMARFYREQYGCDFISAIPTNLYGPGDNYDLATSHLVPALIHKSHLAMADGRSEIEVWGSGKPRREFMLSDDCADALLFLMENYSSEMPINIGTGVDLTVLELAQTVARAIGARVSVRLDPSKPDGMIRKLLDVSRLSELGWRSKIPLEEGIATTYRHFLDLGQHKSGQSSPGQNPNRRFVQQAR